MPKYIKIDDVKAFPTRLNHYDKEHGDITFIYGIETVLEYIMNLPRYEFPEGEPIQEETNEEESIY